MALGSLLATAPSCLTRSVWAGEEFRAETVPRLVSAEVEAVSGTLVVARAGGRVRARLEHAASRSDWLLDAPEGSDAAASILAGAAGRALRVEVRAARERVGGEPSRSDAEVTVWSQFAPEHVGEVIGWAEVEADAAEVLGTERRNAYAFAADPWLHLPPAFRDCLQRLAGMDLGALVGADAGEPVEMLSFVVVDDDGTPCFEPGATRGPAPPPGPPTSFEERLEQLAPLDVLVRARVGGRERLLRVDLEQLWRWSCAERREAELAHGGHWSLRVDPQGDGPVPPGEPLPCSGTLTTRDYELVTTWPVVEDPTGFWERVAWSFLTVPLDVLTAPIQRFFYEGDDDSPRRRWARRR